MNAQESFEDPSEVATRLTKAMPGTPLKVLVMDDNSFDRKTLARLSKKSRYSLEMIEAASIADARVKIEAEQPDVVFLDFRVPDGDGITFSEQLLAQMQSDAPPVVIVTGEGDERTAIRSLRSGVADYLSKDNLNIDVFDGSIARCLAARPINRTDLMDEIDRIGRQLKGLRETTERNMHLARAYLMPMAQYAWQSINPLEGDQRTVEARRLMKIMNKLTGCLDDTLIASATDNEVEHRSLVDLYQLVDDLLNSAPELAEYLEIGNPSRFPTIAGDRSQLLMLMKELIGEALSVVPSDRKPQVRIHCATDPKGNPVLCVSDNGDNVAGRRQQLAGFVEDVGDVPASLPGRTTRMTICQRLANLNGGQLRLSDGRDGGCTVMIRFPKSSAKLH